MTFVTPGAFKANLAEKGKTDAPLARWLWSNVAKPVVRGVAKPFFGLASGITGKDQNMVIPGTNTEIGSGHEFANWKAEKAGTITREELMNRQRKALGQDLGDAFQVGSLALGGAGRVIKPLGAVTNGAIGGLTRSAVGKTLSSGLEGLAGRTGSAALSRLAPKVVPTLAKATVHGVGDATLGAGFGTASALAAGETDPSKILKSAGTMAAGGVGIPLAFGAAGKLAPLARAGLAKTLLGSSKVGFGDALATAEKEWAAKRMAQEASDLAAHRADVTVSGGGKTLNSQRRFATGNLVAPNADTGIGSKLKSFGSRFKDSVQPATLAESTVRGIRRANETFLDSEAPLAAFAKKLAQIDPEGAAAIAARNSEYGAKVDLAYSYAKNNKDKLESMLKNDDRLITAYNEMADLRTKLETPRTHVDPVEVQARKDSLARTMEQLSPEERVAVESAHRFGVEANAANLDRMVEDELISAESAAYYKAKHPNYSKLLIEEHLGQKPGASFGGPASRRSVSDSGLKKRKGEAGFDLDAVQAPEANALAQAQSAERGITNKRNQTIIDVSLKNDTGDFKPLWTVEDEAAKKAALGEMIQRAGIRDALNAEISTVKKVGKVELGKQKVADHAESIRLGNEIRARARANGKTIKENYDSMMSAFVKDTKEQGATEIRKQTAAAAKEASRLAKIARSVEGKGGGTRAKQMVMESNDRAYNQATRDAVAEELGLLNKFDDTARADVSSQADALVAFGKKDALTAQHDFELQAEERWTKILASTDAELRPLVDDLATTNEAKADLFLKLRELRNKAQIAESAKGTVPVMRDGIRELYQATDPRVARYFDKQMTDAYQAPKLVRELTNFTKRFATQINPVFSLKNYMRDTQDRLANIGLGFSPVRMAKSVAAAGDPKSELYKRALELGGPLSSGAYDSSSGFRRLMVKKGKGPISTIEKLSEQSEIATRINILMEAELKGITDPVVLRDLIRSGTLDFSVAGNFTRALNQWVPFTNAAVQGLRVQLKSLAKDPAAYARRQQLLAVYPQLILDSHNSQYASAKNIPQADKQLNHIFVYGEHKDENGKLVADYFKFPKGQATRLFSNITRLLTNEGLTTKEAAKQIMRQFYTMIPVVNVDSSTPVPLPFGSVGQAVYGWIFNKDYMGRDIVSQGNIKKDKLAQVNKYTSNIAKDLAGAIADAGGPRLSPAKIEYVARTLFSGFGSQTVSGLSTGYDVLKGKKVKSTAIPGVQSFLGSSNSGVPLSVSIKNAAADQQMKIASYEKDKKFAENFNLIKNATTPEEQDKVIEDLALSGDLTKDFVDYIKTQKKKKEGTFSVDPTATVAEQAIQMTNYLDSLTSKEERNNAIDSLSNNNLLTKSSTSYIAAYKLYQKLKSASREERNNMIDKMAADGSLTSDVATKLNEYKQMDAP